METEKTPEGEQYDQFRNSFKTINDINDVKIRVEEGEMKDLSGTNDENKRDLESQKKELKTPSGVTAAHPT